MNLSAMTLHDLAQLSEALDLLSRAGAILERLPRDDSTDALRIDLSPGRRVAIVTGFKMPLAHDAVSIEFPLVEVMGGGIAMRKPDPMPSAAITELQPDAGAAAGTWAGSGTCSGFENAESATSGGQLEMTGNGGGGGGGTPATAEPADAKPKRVRGEPVRKRPAIKPGKVFKLGALEPAERETIIQLAALGQPPKQIAEQLQRRVQSVALFLHSVKANQIPAGQPASVVAREPIAEKPAEPAPAVAGGAGPEARESESGPGMPAPDMGQARAPAPVAGGAGSPTFHGRQRLIDNHLTEVGYRGGWGVELDLELVEGLAQGRKAAEVAMDLDLDPKAVAERFRVLSYPIRDDRDRPTIDGMKDLAEVLRHRVKEARNRAA